MSRAGVHDLLLTLDRLTRSLSGSSTQLSKVLLRHGLEAWWALDSTDATQVDSWSTQHLNVSGTSSMSNTAGQFGLGIHWDGGVNGVSVLRRGSADLAPGFRSNDFSVAFWLRKTSKISSMITMGDSVPPNDDGEWAITLYSLGRLLFAGRQAIANNGWSIQLPFDSIPDNTWVHIACTRQQNGPARTYVNGAVAASVTDSGAADLSANPHDFRIGNAFQGAAGNTPTATLDEIGFWSRALSQLDVAYLYNNGAGVPLGGLSA